LLYGLAKSQACGDGNKRIALLLTLAFVRMNGANLRLAPGEMADEILRVATTDPADHDEVVAATTRWVAERLTEAIT
jgi:prophage maintenance system killer protein